MLGPKQAGLGGLLSLIGSNSASGSNFCSPAIKRPKVANHEQAASRCDVYRRTLLIIRHPAVEVN